MWTTSLSSQLSESEILQIVDLFVGRLAKRLAEQDMSIELTNAARFSWPLRVTTRPWVLARCAARCSATLRMLSEKILFGEIKPGEKITVDAEGEGDFPRSSFSLLSR